MNKTIHFISGLPRSGSSLLANLLMQNPKFNVSPTSGILDILFLVRNQWDKLVEFQANPADEEKLLVLRAILDAFYSKKEAPVIFDRSRSWVAHIEMAEAILQRKVKVLVPVRDLRDVLASFEKLYRKTAATSQIPHEEGQYLQWQDINYRCEFWARKDQVVGLAWTRVHDAVARGLDDRMLFVPYEKLTSHPREMMDQVYDFLGEEYYKHNFSSVEQVIHEDDKVHGFTGLHEIRAKIEPQEPQWPSVLGELKIVKDVAPLNFWTK